MRRPSSPWRAFAGGGGTSGDGTTLGRAACSPPPTPFCPYPPGASKWNQIEHRMFSFISLNWRGQPLVSYETVVNLIGATRTRAGLRVTPKLDARVYEAGLKIPEEERKRITLKPHEVHPAWNYTISPRPTMSKQ